MQVSCGGEGTEVWRLRMAPSDAAAAGRILLDGQGVGELAAVLDRASSSTVCRVLVLEAEAGHFCQGMDLERVIADTGAVGPQIGQFADCLRILRTCPQVVLSGVDGDAAGGGVGLAAAADLAVATQGSTFGLPEIALGLLPAVVLPILMERMPPQRARLLCLFDTVDARQALELGLVDRVVQGPAELERALRVAIKAALRASPAAVAGLKALQRQIAHLPCSEALDVGAEQTTSMLGLEQTLAPIRAFLAGEPLPWFSRYRPGGR